MNNLSTYLPDSLINALGWTIIHSLWQGLVIGLQPEMADPDHVVGRGVARGHSVGLFEAVHGVLVPPLLEEDGALSEERQRAQRASRLISILPPGGG